MSHSIVFNEFAKILSKKDLIKTAEKKDPDYNVTITSIGEDTKTDHTGAELIEIAHPDQIFVCDSQLNDGIVENSFEKQKIMVDIARRNPRGVLAELINVLVKSANILDNDMTSESLKMASEVDNYIFKLGQSLGPVLNSEDFKSAIISVLDKFNDLDWSTLGYSTENNSTGKKVINEVESKLRKFLFDAKNAGRGVTKLIYSFIPYIKMSNKMVIDAISKSTDWGKDGDDARIAWEDLYNLSDSWGQEPKPKDVGYSEQEKPVELNSPGMASKLPITEIHKSYPLVGPEVEKLQSILGVKADGKFGPETFNAIMHYPNERLQKFLSLNTEDLSKGYKNWQLFHIEQVIAMINDKKSNTKQPEKDPYDMMPPLPQEQNAIDELKSLFPKVMAQGGRIYPFGILGSAQKYNYPINQKSIQQLTQLGNQFKDRVA